MRFSPLLPELTLLLAMSAALLLAGCGAGGPCELDRIASLPFTVRHQHLEVGALIDGAPARLIFDTGAQTMVIAETSLQKFGLESRPLLGDIHGIGGARQVGLSQSDTIRIGEFRGRDFAFTVSDIFRNRADAPDGIMGMDVLARMDIDLDLRGHEIGFYAPAGGCKGSVVAMSGGDMVTVPLLSEDQESPRIPVTIGGVRLEALIDSGSMENLLFRPAARRLAAAGTLRAGTRHGHAFGIGPEAVGAQEEVAADVAVGDGLRVQNMPFLALEQNDLGSVDLVLGLQFLARVHVWISHSAGLVVMQYPPSPTPPPRP